MIISSFTSFSRRFSKLALMSKVDFMEYLLSTAFPILYIDVRTSSVTSGSSNPGS